MWKMLQQDIAEDYVVGTGVSHSVKDFLEVAFQYLGMEVEWQGSGITKKGLIKRIDNIWRDASVKAGDSVIEIDPRYFRPTEVDLLQADITKARRQLGWEPKIKFEELVKIMLDYDLLSVGLTPPGEGIKLANNAWLRWTNHQFSFHERIRETLG
jgi:GDPmannose 4,6-dehydratase